MAAKSVFTTLGKAVLVDVLVVTSFVAVSVLSPAYRVVMQGKFDSGVMRGEGDWRHGYVLVNAFVESLLMALAVRGLGLNYGPRGASLSSWAGYALKGGLALALTASWIGIVRDYCTFTAFDPLFLPMWCLTSLITHTFATAAEFSGSSNRGHQVTGVNTGGVSAGYVLMLVPKALVANLLATVLCTVATVGTPGFVDLVQAKFASGELIGQDDVRHWFFLVVASVEVFALAFATKALGLNFGKPAEGESVYVYSLKGGLAIWLLTSFLGVWMDYCTFAAMEEIFVPVWFVCSLITHVLCVLVIFWDSPDFKPKSS